MKTKFAFVLAFTMLIVGWYCGASAEQVEKVREGNKPYVPTRLEWLATQLNIKGGHRWDGKYVIDFGALRNDSILIRVCYNPAAVKKDDLKKHVDDAKSRVRVMAMVYGWEKWVAVEEYWVEDKE